MSGLLLTVWLLGLIPGITSSDGVFLNVVNMNLWHGAAYLVMGAAGWWIVRRRQPWLAAYLVGTAAVFAALLVVDGIRHELGGFQLVLFAALCLVCLGAFVSLQLRLRHT